MTNNPNSRPKWWYESQCLHNQCAKKVYQDHWLCEEHWQIHVNEEFKHIEELYYKQYPKEKKC